MNFYTQHCLSNLTKAIILKKKKHLIRLIILKLQGVALWSLKASHDETLLVSRLPARAGLTGTQWADHREESPTM